MSSESMIDLMDHQFGYILKRTQQALRTRMDKELRAHNITVSQYAVLSAVAATPDTSNADLAKAAFVTPQTMQGIIATMEKRGLLERFPDPKHGRRLMTQLTINGDKVRTEVDMTVKKVQAMMLGSISQDKIEQATTTLLTCIKNLSE
jgi:DNA-binding MarR family transcriptional regulator